MKELKRNIEKYITVAYYSFGMSMQSLMTVFIISIAQPLFPAMAQGKFKDE